MRTIEEIVVWSHRCGISECKTNDYHGCPYGSKGLTDCVDRLEEDYVKIMDAVLNVNSIDRLEEICNAERDGRLVVLPCEVGSDTYWINEENEVKCHKNGVRGIVIRKDKILIEDTDGCIDEIGTEYCYLSREEAEKALKGGAKR